MRPPDSTRVCIISIPKTVNKPGGDSTYTDNFKETYFRAQSERMNRLIQIARVKIKQMKPVHINILMRMRLSFHCRMISG